MQFEVERKFWVDDFSPIFAFLAEQGSEVREPVEQLDQYFTHPQRDFYKTDEVLRLRQVGSKNVITYKGARIDATTKTRQEMELDLPDGESIQDQFGTLLSVLGFEPLMIVRKSRKIASLTWDGTGVEICFDEISQLGNFVELEVTTDAQNIDAAKGLLASLAERLNLERSERRSYVELLMHQLAPHR